MKINIPAQEGVFEKFNLVCAMSYQHGVEAVYITGSIINSDEFVKIITMCRTLGKDFTLFGDNATWHTSTKTKVLLNHYNLDFICNLPH